MNNSYSRHPQVAVGAVVFSKGKVLLVRRGKSPGAGIWAIPGGKVKLGETLQQAAERELLEETSVLVKAKNPVYTFDVITYDQEGKILYHYVIVDMTADYVSGRPTPGGDALQAGWISASEMKAMRVSEETRKLLQKYFNFHP